MSYRPILLEILYLISEAYLWPCQASMMELFYEIVNCYPLTKFTKKLHTQYGLLCHSLCDSLVQYTYFTLSHILVNLIQQMALPLTIMYNKYTEYLRNEASKCNRCKGCNISMDRCFTSVTVARWGLEKG